MDEALMARLFGLGLEEYCEVKNRFDANGGLSAHTTAMVLRRFVPNVVVLKPDWILCLLGGNDATRIGPEPNKPQVSPEETARNLEAMRRIARGQTEAEWVWITPPTYDEQRDSSFPPFEMGQSVFRNDDIVAVGGLVRARKALSWTSRRSSDCRRTRSFRVPTASIPLSPARRP